VCVGTKSTKYVDVKEKMYNEARGEISECIV
jgi:hypothetical protein